MNAIQITKLAMLPDFIAQYKLIMSVEYKDGMWIARFQGRKHKYRADDATSMAHAIVLVMDHYMEKKYDDGQVMTSVEVN